MKYLLTLATLITSIFFSSCKKDDTNYHLEGKVTSGEDGSAMSGVSLTLEKQVVQTGVYTNSYSTAADATTDGSGNYAMSWARENFSAFRLNVEKDQYCRRVISLDPNRFSAGTNVTENVKLYPEAFINLHIQNVDETTPQDEFLFTYVNANFDCVCCSNEWKVFEGVSVDTSISCRLYGNSWLKYQIQIHSLTIDSVGIDSIWVPAFQTTNLNLTY